MRTGAAAGCPGYYHEAALYGSDAELLDVVVPFLQDGLASGEPTVVTFASTNAALVRDELGPDCGITFLPGADQYARPATAIRAYQQMFEQLTAGGAAQIRVVGDVPHPGTGGSWRDWARYEVLVNDAYDAYPVWGLCPYDLRTAPQHVIDDVLATHPHIASAGGLHHHNDGFDAEHRLLQDLPSVDLCPDRPADVTLLDPDPGSARRAAVEVATRAGLGGDPIASLEVTISELVTNAIRWGLPPVACELWSEPGRVTVSVTDAGDGVDDPCAGLVRGTRDGGGLGLWLAHQVCDDVVVIGGPGRSRVTATITDR